jgi:sortase A
MVVAILLGGLVVVLATAVVLYGIGPMIEGRDQYKLMATERTAINDTLGEASGPNGVQLPTQPPVPGSPVGIVVIPALRLQAAVVEGVSSTQTMSGIGHVPGTAGLGQPGNAAVVGRKASYGGLFAHLDNLVRGDRIITATIEGQSVYRVRSVRMVTLSAPGGSTTPTTAPLFGRSQSSSGGPTFEGIYGPSKGDQLTLVTSASNVPWNAGRAVVVVAKMQSTPYAPTPQESLSPSQFGNSGEGGAWAQLLLALLAMGALAVGAVALYRRATTRSAYLLTIPPLLACTVLAVEAASRLLPAWL